MMYSLEAFADEMSKLALTNGQRAYRRKSGNYFGGSKKLNISRDEAGEFNARKREAGVSPTSCSLKKTEKGFTCHTHRARCGWYPSPSKIPLAKIRFIASTG